MVGQEPVCQLSVGWVALDLFVGVVLGLDLLLTSLDIEVPPVGIRIAADRWLLWLFLLRWSSLSATQFRRNALFGLSQSLPILLLWLLGFFFLLGEVVFIVHREHICLAAFDLLGSLLEVQVRDVNFLVFIQSI